MQWERASIDIAGVLVVVYIFWLVYLKLLDFVYYTISELTLKRKSTFAFSMLKSMPALKSTLLLIVTVLTNTSYVSWYSFFAACSINI